MDDRTNALPVGTELEGYRIVALLGAGGFGITYKAVDLLLDRPVAIKEYLPSVLASRGADRKTVRAFGRQEQEQFAWGLERFRSEARTLVAFQHSHIVPVHRYFEANGTGYLVMAFQDGKSLADVIDAVGTLSEDELLTILRPLATGLADVHAKGFLHRDIKPANIIIRRDGTPVLIDFGAARQAVTRQSRGLTAIVTEGYAPYEQYETDSHQGPWTDIYALGAVLYHCVTGQRPPESPKRIAAQLRKQPDPMMPASQAAAGSYSESLLHAIDCALAVAEDKRPQNVRELMSLVEGRGAPPEAAEASAAENFMVEPPSQPPGRGREIQTATEPDSPSAEVAGNLMVEAPSAPVGRRAVKVAPPAVPLAERARAPGATPEAPAASPGSNTLTVGGQTLLVGGAESEASLGARGGARLTEPPPHAARLAGVPAAGRKPRQMLPLLASVIGVMALGGVAVGYLTQRQSIPPPPAVSEPPAKADALEAEAPKPAAPAPPKPSEEALARSRAGAPAQLWQHLSAKQGQDVVRRIFVLANDQLLIAGGRIEEGSNSDAWLWRFDAREGKPLGERTTFANARFDSGNAVVRVNDGSTVMAAARRSAGTNSIVAWVARIGPEGEAQWQHTFSHSLAIPYALTTLPSGDVVVVGTAKLGDKGLQGWAARLSADGKKVEWDKVFGQPGDDSLQAVAVLPDGGIIAVGWASVERPAAEDRNLWILALDGEGNVRWEKKDLGDEADEKGKALAVTPEGDVLVVAEVSRAPAVQSPRPRARQGFDTAPVNKPWILRLAPDGAVRWDKRDWGGKPDRSDSLDAIAAAGDGGFVLAGSTESKGSGRKDGWLVRIDGDGNRLWDQVFGEQFDDEFTALTGLLDGGVLVGGATIKLEAPAGPIAVRPQGEAKLWIMRLGYNQ